MQAVSEKAVVFSGGRGYNERVKRSAAKCGTVYGGKEYVYIF